MTMSGPCCHQHWSCQFLTLSASPPKSSHQFRGLSHGMLTLWAGPPCCGMLSSIPGLCPLHASSPSPSVMVTKNVYDTARCDYPLGKASY